MVESVNFGYKGEDAISPQLHEIRNPINFPRNVDIEALLSFSPGVHKILDVGELHVI